MNVISDKPQAAQIGVALYLSAMAVIATRVSVHGDNSFLWLAYVWFATACSLAALTGAVRDLLQSFRNQIANWLMLAFFANFAYMAATHPDPEISSGYLKDLFKNCLPMVAAGFILSTNSARKKHTARRTLAVMAATLLIIFVIAVPQARDDIFLIVQPEGLAPQYQYFGDHLTLFVLSGILLLSAQGGPWSPVYDRSWSALPFLFVVSFFAAQLVGSNNATVLFGMLAISLGIGSLVTLYRRGMIADFKLFIVASIMAAIICLSVIALVPPLRILNFGDGDVASKVPGFASIVSRADLLEDSTGQFSINIVFGELAADNIASSPGEYLHSVFAVQSHLGLVGSTLFFVFLALKLRYLYSSGPDIKKWITPPILTVAVLATFFTWQPLWFLIGMLMPIRNRPAKTSSSGVILGNRSG